MRAAVCAPSGNLFDKIQKQKQCVSLLGILNKYPNPRRLHLCGYFRVPGTGLGGGTVSYGVPRYFVYPRAHFVG